MSLTDNMFGCDESPVWFPAILDINEIPLCSSCILRITAPTPGPGTVVLPNRIDENPLTTLSINGIQHNLLETLLYFPGVHRFPNNATVHDGEILFYFRNINDPSSRVVLCVPIVTQANKPSSAYFSTLVQGGISAKRPTMTTLLDKQAIFVSYKGADVFGRTAKDSRPRKVCQPVAFPITYYVSMTPTHIHPIDKNRLSALMNSSPPTPMTEVARARILQLATRITGIKIDDGQSQRGGGSGSGPTTAAMKCYRLDTERDIVGNKVYIGGKKPTKTLEEELAAAKTAVDKPVDYSVDASAVAVQPGDIERILGIVVGVALGVIVCATVAYYVWNSTFRNYLNVQKLYDSPISAAKLSAKFPELPSLCPSPA